MLESQNLLKKVLYKYFKGLKHPPVAWCTSAGPAEILRALGFVVYFPENHAAMLGASRVAEKYIPRAHQAGFTGEICSYLTSDIGAFLMNESPLKKIPGIAGLPEPDMIVYNTNQCREVAEWFNWYGRHFKCPVVGVYPPRHLEAISDADLQQVVEQLKNVIRTGEEVVGHKLDRGKLVEVLELSHAGSQLWKTALATARNTPAPLTFFDCTILMAPIVMLRGTTACVEFYRKLVAELEGMVSSSTGALPVEKSRIYWEGMPIWGRLRKMSDLFKANAVAVVASTYCNSWVFDDFDTAHPLRSMAMAYTQIFINRGENTKLAFLEKMVDEFAIDGVIFHDSKTCANNSNNRFGLDARLNESTGIPTLTIDGDLNDLRFFSDGQTRTRLETFFEQLIPGTTVVPA
jgi:benzoyl-CoA reductase/2-hydroxyglutaryl-CoA dehydratase subunit BcrC/BadD/HgdB